MKVETVICPKCNKQFYRPAALSGLPFTTWDCRFCAPDWYVRACEAGNRAAMRVVETWRRAEEGE